MTKCSGREARRLNMLALVALFILLLGLQQFSQAEESANVATDDPERDAQSLSAPEIETDQSAQNTAAITAKDSNADNPNDVDKSKDEKPIADAKKGDKDKKENASDAKDSAKATEEDVVIPPPEPTAEEVAKRKEKAAEYQSLGEKKFGFPVTGSLWTRYRLRHGLGDTVEDISEFVTIDIGDKARQMATVHIDARAYEGFDRHHTPSDNVFTSLLDTYSELFVARLYSAYVDFNHLSGIDVLRVGRQFDFDTPEILEYDGVRLDTQPIDKLEHLSLCFYGGVPVHQYETSVEGDWLAGMAAEIKPWERTRIRFDYVHVNDSFSDWVTNSKDPLAKSLSPIDGTRSNDLASASFWQSFKNPNINLNGHFSVIDGEARDLSARAVYNDVKSRLQVMGTYSVWFKPETQFVTEFDPYYETLKGQEPYQNGSVRASKGLLEWLELDVGADTRRLIHKGEAKLFNREFDRFYATLQTRDILKKGLSISATATHWEGKDGAPTTTQFGAEAAYQWKKHLETIAGTDYALYRYDLFQNTEHDEDRVYYLRQRWKPTRWASLDARYEFEQSRSQSFQTFILQFRFDF